MSYLEAGKNVFTLFKNRGWEAIIADVSILFLCVCHRHEHENLNILTRYLVVFCRICMLPHISFRASQGHSFLLESHMFLVFQLTELETHCY